MKTSNKIRRGRRQMAREARRLSSFVSELRPGPALYTLDVVARPAIRKRHYRRLVEQVSAQA